MKIFLVFCLCTITANSQGYNYNKPNVGFYPEDLNRPAQTAHIPLQQSLIIRGDYGKNYEVTMVPSEKLFETKLQQNVVIGANPVNIQYQNPHASQAQTRALTSSNPGFYTNPFNTNVQQQPDNQYAPPINQPQQNAITNQYYTGLTTNSYAANAQQHLNQYSNLNLQQQGVITALQQQQQRGLFSQQQRNNNLLYDLVNNNKYVSQSQASQLDVYPFKQLTIGNTRPFTRIITKCDAKGNCEQQNVADVEDFQHQQVLKQLKAKIEPISDKCRTNNYSPNALNSQNLQNTRNEFSKGVSGRKGTNLRDRRLFPYSEQVIAQYPTN